MMIATVRAIATSLLAFVVSFALAAPAHAGVDDFNFTSFAADYTLTRDADHVGHLHVVEHLEAVFPEEDQNHGIIRAIPETYEGHGVHLKVASVTDGSGDPIPYSSSSSSHNLALKIGNADRYVHGAQTYIITYDMDHVTAKPSGYDGLFWDVNGDQWAQQFGEVSARIHIDPSLVTARDASHDRCFTGARGSQAQNCNVEDAGVITVRATDLSPGQTLTFELGFKPGTFAAYSVPIRDIVVWAVKILLFFILPIGATLWFIIRRWWRYGRDPAGRGVIIPEYTPPRELSVLGASAILHEGFRPSAITATILDLAVRGYVRILETKTAIPLLPDKHTYELELTRSTDDLKSEEKRVIAMVFGSSQRVDISSLKTKLFTEAATLGKAVNQTVTDDGYFASNPDQAKSKYYLIGALLMAAGGICTFLTILAVGLVISGAIVLAFARVMPARTAKGVETRDLLLGLKMFITTVETNRIQAMQSPHGELTEKIDTDDKAQLVKVYEKLLPYAMLFGVEKDWIKEFAGLYQEPPDWYHGSSAFNAAYFAGAMSSFTTASNAGFTPPSSSGSGGSAGGGGGGGGGGGW